MTSVDIPHSHVLSAELRTDSGGTAFLEIMTDLPPHGNGGEPSADFAAMSAEVEALRQQLPLHRRGSYITFITASDQNA